MKGKNKDVEKIVDKWNELANENCFPEKEKDVIEYLLKKFTISEVEKALKIAFERDNISIDDKIAFICGLLTIYCSKES